MKGLFTAKRLCRAGVIAALYAAIALIQPYSSTPIQCRLSEALTILPLFFAEAVPGLFIGCFFANIMGGAADMLIGSGATLLASLCTYFIGRAIKNTPVRLILGEFPPVFINAFLIPVVFIIGGSANYGYFVEVGIMIAGQAAAVCIFGTALYFAVSALQKKGVRVFTDGASMSAANAENAPSGDAQKKDASDTIDAR